jgi:DNA-binding winged helix-turn-helix (wHTH) protein/pimeloyl-ACP methyl ester carboxylesterase
MSSGVYRFGPFVLDVGERLLLRDTSAITLRGKVFDALCVLVENAGRLVRKEELLSAIWPDSVVEENNLTQSVSILRKALGEGATGQFYIETIPRIGYRFVANVTPVATAGAPSAARPSAPDRRSRQEIRYCKTDDGVSIAYATVGTGYPLVKAANWLNHLEYEWDSPLWRHWIDELMRRHTIIRYDERGNGLSSWEVEDISLAAWIRDFETVIEAAAPQKFAVMGISQGGAVAIDYAVRHPERVSHLILCGAYSRGYAHRGSPETLRARQALETLVRLDWGKSNPAFSSLFTNVYVPENATMEHQRWFNDLQRISASPENAARIMEACDAINVRHLLPRLAVPTLVFHSDRDRAVPAEEGRVLAAEIPNARFVPLSTGNHILLADEPAWNVFLEEMGAFLGWQDTSAHAGTKVS